MGHILLWPFLVAEKMSFSFEVLPHCQILLLGINAVLVWIIIEKY